jgi:hypothetical protein
MLTFDAFLIICNILPIAFVSSVGLVTAYNEIIIIIKCTINNIENIYRNF